MTAYLCLLGAFAGCSVTSIEDELYTSPYGTYALEQIDSQDLPFVSGQDDTQRFETLSGSFTLRINRTCVASSTIRRTDKLTGTSEDFESRTEGTYSIDRDSLTVDFPADGLPGPTAIGALAGSELTLRVASGFTLLYRKP